MRKQQDLLSYLRQELNAWKQKTEELEELMNNKPGDIPVDDLARRATKIFENGAKKTRAIAKMASKGRR